MHENEDEVVHYEVGADGCMNTLQADDSSKPKFASKGSYEGSVSQRHSIGKLVYGDMQQHGEPTRLCSAASYVKEGTFMYDSIHSSTHQPMCTAPVTTYETVSTMGRHEDQQPIRLVSTMSQTRIRSGGDFEETDMIAQAPEHTIMATLPGEVRYVSASPEDVVIEACSPEDIEAAIACERIYAPQNASFVPGNVVKQAGIVTAYDSSLIPTFEHDLEVTALPKPIIFPQHLEEQLPTASDETGEKVERTTNPFMKRVAATTKRRMQCC